MSATGYTPISLYYSSTSTNVPLAANLVAGELAINTADGKLFYKDSGGTVQVLATKGSAAVGGSNTQVQYNSSGTLAGSANLTFDGTTLTAAGLSDSGNLTFTGTGNRITGDFSNATLANRVWFRDATTNNSSTIGVLPNGTSAVTSVIAFGGSDPDNAPRIQMRVDGASEVQLRSEKSGTGSYLPMTFHTGGSERMRIDTSGNVGIGTSSPSSFGKLTVMQTSGSTALQINTTTNGAGMYWASTNSALVSQYSYGGTLSIGTVDSNAFNFLTNNTERMRIDSSGNVGIGTSSPGQKLDVSTTGSSAIRATRSTAGQVAISVTSTLDTTEVGKFAGGESYLSSNGAYALTLWTNGTEKARISSAGGFSVGTTADPGAGAIYATGNITAYYSSDARLKENIKDVDNALDIVCAIGSKTFDWTDEYIASKGGEDGYFVQKADFGVVAQDVQEVFPQAVRTREDGTLAVDYEKLATLSFGAIKSLLARVEALEAK